MNKEALSRMYKSTLQEAESVSEEIIQLAQRGWLLHPCKQGGKTPLTRWKTAASCEPKVIQKWIAEHPGCNWAVVCGPHSGVWVLDVDGDEGNTSLASLVTQFGALPQTLTSLTGRGRHIWFRYPRGVDIPSSVELRRHLDVRAGGGYVIVPPSLHASGKQYSWEDKTVLVADPPEWLIDLVSRPISDSEENLAREILPAGRRNSSLTRRAGQLRRRGANEADILATLESENLRRCRPPLPHRELVGIAKSVQRYTPGGPDALDRAWAKTQAENLSTNYERFIALTINLQRELGKEEIALPIVRISKLLGVDHTMVSRYRSHAVDAGLLVRTAPPIRGRRAAYYRLAVVSLTEVVMEPPVPIAEAPRCGVSTGCSDRELIG